MKKFFHPHLSLSDIATYTIMPKHVCLEGGDCLDHDGSTPWSCFKPGEVCCNLDNSLSMSASDENTMKCEIN